MQKTKAAKTKAEKSRAEKTKTEKTKAEKAFTPSLKRDPLVRGLGVASAMLGVPQVTRPGEFARGVGVQDAPRHRLATTAVGVRELVAAAGLLGRPHPAWLWGRVGGDVMDLTMLARALKSHDGGRSAGRAALATAATAAITVTDVYAAVTRTRGNPPVELTSATTVNRSADDTYGLWRRLDRLPTFMAHVDEVLITGPRTSHWKASAPFGATVEWDAEITDEEPGERIAWRSREGAGAEGADIRSSGEVRFVPAPGGRGTEVRVTLHYHLPAGPVGRAVARYFGEEPSQQLDDDLRRFKLVAETGEVVRSEGAPGGKRARGGFPQHPARPLTEDELREALS